MLILYHERIVNQLHDSGGVGVAGGQPWVEAARGLFDRDDKKAGLASTNAAGEAGESKDCKKANSECWQNAECRTSNPGCESCASSEAAAESGEGSAEWGLCRVRRPISAGAQLCHQRGCWSARFNSAILSFKRDAESSVSACGGEIEDLTLAMLSKDLLIL